VKIGEPCRGPWRLVLTTWAMILTVCCFALALEPPVVPVVDAHLGKCTATFTIRDKNHNPIYDAKIEVDINYGFLGLRKMALEVGTNSDGKARVAGLPERPKKPFQFRISQGSLSKTIPIDPSEKCDALIEADLTE
jgi:hypothetical protein